MDDSMTCQEALDRLSPYLDDELDPLISREVADHLAGCAPCAAELERQETLRARLRREVEYHRAPEELRARLLRATRGAAASDVGRRRRPALRWWRGLAAAAALVVVAGAAWLSLATLRERTSDAFVREGVSAHIRSLMAGHLTDVASTDQHTVKPWFDGRLDFSPPVADLAGAGFPLVGGRLDYLHGRAVAALVYRRRQHVINVFVWPVEDAGTAIEPVVTRNGYHVIRARHAHMALWLISDVNPQELAELARLLTAPPA